MDNHHTFTASGSLPSLFRTKGRYSEVVLGEAGDSFPASVIIKKVNQKGTKSPLRTFTAAPENMSVLLETTPGSSIDIEVTGAIYVELNNLTE